MKCRFPIQLKDDKGHVFYVPCGKCAWCLRTIRDQWVLRLHQESKEHNFSSFVTLTYRDQDLPYNVNEDTGELVPTVCKADIQHFNKSLWNTGYKFRFMVTSEYGPKTLRPHYHGIYFHDEPMDFEKLWSKGDNNVQLPAKESSFKYVLKYILKGSTVPDGADPNFRLMSRRPGLGSSFVYKGTPYIVTYDGVKCAVPHYYSRKYEASLSEKLRDSVKTARLDYLSSLDRHSSLKVQFRENTGLQFDDPQFEHQFEDWLFDIYKKDYVKQVKINKNVDF